MATNKKKTKKPEKKLFNFTLKGSTGWIVTLVFVSAWMFFLGILVGRGTIPLTFKSKSLQQELTELKEADTKALLNRVEINTDTQKTKKEMDFYEKLKQSKEKPRLRTKAPPKQTTQDRKSKSGKPKAKPPEKKTAKPKEETPKPRQAATSDRAGSAKEKNLAIQVGSFRDAAEADSLIRVLKSKGYPAFKETGIVEGRGVWYRVRIGYYDDRNEANRVLKQLKQGGQDGYVVKR